MTASTDSSRAFWKIPLWAAALLVVGILALIAAFYPGLERMVYRWGSSEEYGYGYLIPFIAAFFIWQKKNELARLEFRGSWAGVVLLLIGVSLLLVGELATLFIIMQYGFLVALAGLVLAFMGWDAFKRILPPLAVLVFMIPLPNFLYKNLSAELQLISSQIGVWVIRLFGISVYLEGNVIDLGTYKLQVVEACSGLRYLFPLTSLAFIAAYLFRGAFWKKALIFVSSAPITVLMNSFRIGMIGVLVEYGGPEQAEGFLHDFEGWVVFMGCIGILILEMWLLARVGQEKKTLAEVFAIDFPEPLKAEPGIIRTRKLAPPSVVALIVALLSAPVPALIKQRPEVIPDRRVLAEFPLVLGEWYGSTNRLEQIYIDTLKFDDYLMADYRRPDGSVVNFYVAYYASQRKGESAHSPRSCIPGGGWEIKSHEEKTIDIGSGGGKPLVVNRLLIRKGDYSQLVYYWFAGRGRDITDEYLVKWYIFLDSLTRGRTDGALVRLTAMVKPGEKIEDVDARMSEFAKLIEGPLGEFVPD